jgi:hypothetical protein
MRMSLALNLNLTHNKSRVLKPSFVILLSWRGDSRLSSVDMVLLENDSCVV